MVKPLYTFDQLMVKYKKQKADSENQPIKKESLHLLSVKLKIRSKRL